MKRLLSPLLLAGALSGCNLLGESGEALAARREADDYMRDNQLQPVAPQFSNAPDVAAEAAKPAQPGEKAKKDS